MPASDAEYSSNDSDSDDTFSGDEYRRDSHPRLRSPAVNAGSPSHHPRRESFGTSDTELRPRRRQNDPSRQVDNHSEAENDEEPRSSHRRAAQELHVPERLMPQVDELRRQAMEASSRGNPRQPRPLIDVDDDELQKVFKASLAEEKARKKRIRQREEEVAAREAADETAAIAESARLAANPTAAHRRDADADAELERVLRESAAEAEEKKAREKAELSSLHARFGVSSDQQPRSSPSPDSAPSASSQRDRANSAPRSPAAPSTSQRERSNSAPREPTPSSTERLMSAGNNLLRRGVELARRPSARATPAVQQPRRATPARLAEILPDEPATPSSAAAAPQRNSPRAEATRPRARPDPPRPAPESPRAPANVARERADPLRRQPSSSRRQPHAQAPQPSSSRRQPRAPAPQPSSSRRQPRAPAPQPGSSRRQPRAPAPQPNQLGRRNSERAPHVERQPLRRAPSPSSRRYPERARNHGELDPSIRQALNNSERWARLEQGRGGGRNLREEEQMRMAIQNSLGDAPLPPDPIEGLIDPPPPYHKIGRDKRLDPLRYTTTNEKGNEPGHKRYITPEILDVMKKFLLQQHKFDAKAKASGNDLPPANNAMAKKQKRAPVVDNSPVAGSSSSAAHPVDSLENLLGTRLPPPRLARGTPTNRAASSSNDNAFVSRVPGLASNARERIPRSRPWDNAFSRLPRDRRSPSGRS